jgi:hypothetical protein
MARWFFGVFALLLLCSSSVWAQRTAQEDDRAARKQWEEDQRADEYATSLRRRDWLKDRLLLELGMGTKFPAMGANWFGFGAGVEYITRWHVAGFITGGFIPSHEDPVYPDLYNLDGGMGWRIGLAYYMFPKNPIHLGFHASYGTVFYDHESDDHESGVRKLITCRGYEFDISVSYLSDQWYFLQAMIGVYNIGNGLKDGGNTMGRTNDSWQENLDHEIVSLVPSTDPRKEAIPPVGVVFGISVGFAFEEFFPDETEIRRRERESSRGNSNLFRNTPSKRPTPAKRSGRIVEDEDED